MHVITAGSGDCGRRGYSSRVRSARGYADSGPNWEYPAGSSSRSSTFAYDPNTDRPRARSRSFGDASAATVGPALGAGANGLNAGWSSSEAKGLNTVFAPLAKGLKSGSSPSSSPNGLRDRVGGGDGAGAAPGSHDARAAFDPRSASSQ